MEFRLLTFHIKADLQSRQVKLLKGKSKILHIFDYD